MSIVVLCSRCSAGYVARRAIPNGLCPDCRKIAALEAMRRAREKSRVVPVGLNEAVERNVGSLTVVHDPLEYGGFDKGVQFVKEEWEQMLKHLSFTPGTLLRDADRRLYVFRGTEVWHEK